YVEINPEEITENSRFSEDLGFNSYDFVSMLGDAEEEFGIEISQDEASARKTVGALVDYFEEISA
ncbi:MAG: acyl carrier protein, partial [Oscillospiraceae bacterium]|nr:acyl carrier protein [Oscillospiraceae bacterium]